MMHLNVFKMNLHASVHELLVLSMHGGSSAVNQL